MDPIVIGNEWQALKIQVQIFKLIKKNLKQI